MNACSVDIKDMLLAEPTLGLEFAVNLFVGKEPSSPDNCVTIFDTPGQPPFLGLIKEEGYYYPSVQIRVRNIDYINGWLLINKIKELLHNRGAEIVNNTIYTVIACSAEPALLDWDEKERARFVMTLNIQRQKA